MAKTAFFKAILKFCTTNKIFVYFRLRYTKQQIAVLNNVVRTRGKVRTLKFSAAFLKACISKRVAPKYIVARIERSRARHSPEMERAFLTDDVEKLTEQSRKLQTINQSHWRGGGGGGAGGRPRISNILRHNQILQIPGTT